MSKLTLFTLEGSLQYFDEKNDVIGQDDIFSVDKRYSDYCHENGIVIRQDLSY